LPRRQIGRAIPRSCAKIIDERRLADGRVGLPQRI
jgi:hypothetical protein